MAYNEKKKESNAKHDKANFQYITFKARIGAKDRIKEAAQAAGDTTNGFIRKAVDKAVQDVIGKPMEEKNEDI